MKKSNETIIKQIPDFLDYCDVVKGLSNKSVENYGRFLNKFVGWLGKKKLDHLKPHELGAEHVYQYRLYLSRNVSPKDGKNLKKNTQNYYLIALRALLVYFAKHDILALPAERIELAKEPKNRNVHFLKLEQIEKLLLSPNLQNILGLRDRAILETLFSTGLRVGELVDLNKDQINVAGDSELEIPITGKGGYTRTVYFSGRAVEWLKNYLLKRKDNEKALFISYTRTMQPGKRLSVRAVEKIIKKYVKLSGLPLNTTPHTLRHSYATDLLNQGVDIRLVQEFLGHQNIATTQIYTHVTNKKLRDVHREFHSGEKLRNY